MLVAVGLGAFTLIDRGSNASYEGPAILAQATHNQRAAYAAGDLDGYSLLADTQTEAVETPSSLLTICEDLQESGDGAYGSGSWSPGAPAWASLYPNWYVLGCEQGSAKAVRKVWGESITTPTVLLPGTSNTTSTTTTTILPAPSAIRPGFKPTGAGEPWVVASREFVYALQQAYYQRYGVKLNVKGTHFWLSDDAKNRDWFMFTAVPQVQSLESSDGFGWAELQGGSWTAIYGPYNQGCQWPSSIPTTVLADFGDSDAGC
jgi:hypothetical protein